MRSKKAYSLIVLRAGNDRIRPRKSGTRRYEDLSQSQWHIRLQPLPTGSATVVRSASGRTSRREHHQKDPGPDAEHAHRDVPWREVHPSASTDRGLQATRIPVKCAHRDWQLHAPACDEEKSVTTSMFARRKCVLNLWRGEPIQISRRRSRKLLLAEFALHI
jgi:hypothetical protein